MGSRSPPREAEANEPWEVVLISAHLGPWGKAWLILLKVGAVVSKQVLPHQMLGPPPSILPLPNIHPKMEEVNERGDGCVVLLEPHPLPKEKWLIFHFLYNPCINYLYNTWFLGNLIICSNPQRDFLNRRGEELSLPKLSLVGHTRHLWNSMIIKPPPVLLPLRPIRKHCFFELGFTQILAKNSDHPWLSLVFTDHVYLWITLIYSEFLRYNFYNID